MYERCGKIGVDKIQSRSYNASIVKQTEGQNMYDILDIHTEAKQAAKNAVGKFLSDWNEKTGGNDYGEPM